jgi:hypothetical protein
MKESNAVLCPWCMHCGAVDDEYLFDAELYCGICAQQMPQTEAEWTAAFRAMSSEALSYVEEELNRIAASKSGMRPELLAAMGEGLTTIASLRESGGPRQLQLPEEEYVKWVRFACTYYAPRLR